MRVCPHDNLKTIARICFLLGSYVDWRKPRTSSHVRVTDQGQGHFSEGLRLLSKSYPVADSELPSLIASFSIISFICCH